MIRALAKRADALGYRKALAWAASAAFIYRGQWFTVDEAGRWVNHHRGRQITSPGVFINDIAALELDALDIFNHAYPVQPGDTVFDVGAGIGTETALWARLVGARGRVFAIEAHPITAAALLANTAHLPNVKVLECAITDRDGLPVFIGETDNHVANRIGASGFQVPGRTIDALAAQYGVARIDFLKMNIEGAETAAVSGMVRNLPRNLCVSCHDFLGAETATEALVRSQLARRGYNLDKPRIDDRPWVQHYVYAKRVN